MRLLPDQGLPRDSASLFRQLGQDCRQVSEFGMQQAADEEILTFARGGDWVVVTLDADFHALMAVRSLDGHSVIRLRREGCRAEEVVQIVVGVLERFQARITEGCLISVKAKQVTCHRLPVGRVS